MPPAHNSSAGQTPYSSKKNLQIKSFVMNFVEEIVINIRTHKQCFPSLPL